MSLHILAFQNIPEHFKFFPYKNLQFLRGQGSPPPPLADMFAMNVSFLLTAPLILRFWVKFTFYKKNNAHAH